jgi:hypothetical protein
MEKLVEFVTNPLFLVLIGFIMLLLTFNFLQRLSRSRVWKQIATDFGLLFSKHQTATYRDQQLSGVYRKRPITLIESISEEHRADRLRSSSERGQTNTDTEIRIKLNISKDVKMRLHRIIVIGEADQATGDINIDRHFTITSEPNWLTKKLLASPNIYKKLHGLKMGGDIRIAEAELYFTQTGCITDGKYLRFLFDFLGDLADVVEGATSDLL